MRAKSRKKSWFRGWRSGLTLIEVVVGIALAGTLLVSTIMATTAHRRQVQLANSKRQAIQSLDNFLAAWSQFKFDAAAEEQAARQSDIALESGLIGVARQSKRIKIATRTVDSIQDLNIEIVRVEAWGADSETPITWLEIARPRSNAP